MRAREFLVEYNRNITAQQVGDRIISAFSKDTSAEIARLVPHLGELSNSLRTLSRVSPEQVAASITPERRSAMIDLILRGIEQKDPTTNKAYTPWLAKMYAKAGGGLKMEDINRQDMIRLYDLAKKRRMIKPEHADINRFKWYQDFEDTMENEYNNLNDVEQGKEQEQGSASKVYEDGDVLVVVPHDEAAACRYGRETRWCTAATRGDNYFDQYNRQGKLYILIPKNPQHEGEKYQLHFPSNQFMDEDDSDVDSLYDLLTDRFPGLEKFFLKEEPSLKNTIMFTSDQELKYYIDQIANLASDHLDEVLNNWQDQDDYYYRHLQDTYPDEEGGIDWEEVEKNDDGYLSFNDDARRFKIDMEEAIRPSPDTVKGLLNPGFDIEANADLQDLPDVIAANVKNEFPDRRETDGGMADFIKRNIGMRKVADNYEAYLVQRRR